MVSATYVYGDFEKWKSIPFIETPRVILETTLAGALHVILLPVNFNAGLILSAPKLQTAFTDDGNAFCFINTETMVPPLTSQAAEKCE